MIGFPAVGAIFMDTPCFLTTAPGAGRLQSSYRQLPNHSSSEHYTYVGKQFETIGLVLIDPKDFLDGRLDV